MAVHEYRRGHKIPIDNIGMPMACAHCDKEPISVDVCLHDCPRVDVWSTAPVDACIADIVQALNIGGCLTESSCCGHNQFDGLIVLQDGRRLIVAKDDVHASIYQDAIGEGDQCPT